MLNRIYIIVGVLAIIVLGGAFIVPRFIQWGDYRDRMQALATEALGADVTIRGAIDFTLLPQPRVVFSDVLVGPEEAPVATIAGVEAEFGLVDFLRDQYSVTRLVLQSPMLELAIDENGLFGSGFALTGGTSVGLGQASLANGSLRFIDQRSGEMVAIDGIGGDIRLSSFSGPFQFQGHADYQGSPVSLRINSGAVDGSGVARFSAFAGDAGNTQTLSLDGVLTPGQAPKFDGKLTYRQTPPAAENANDMRGALVFESPVAASTDRLVFNGYTLLPDENRAAVRLSGAASVQLGANPNFVAVVSGGVVSLPPRDATEVAATMPYEGVRLLSELQAPPVPPIPGTIDLDLAEIGLRGAALRNVTLDATTDGQSWQVSKASGELPGNSLVTLAGTLSNADGRAGFAGTVSIETARLDALAQLWRRPVENSPLFNVPARLDAQLRLAGDALGLSHGQLTLNGVAHAIEGRIGFGDEKRLDMVGNFDDLGAADSAILAALLPDPVADSSFGNSFPEGSFSLTAQSLQFYELAARDAAAEGNWSAGRLHLGRLSASDWGGVTLDATAELAGDLTAPVVTGTASIGIAEAGAPGLARLYDLGSVPQGWRQALAGAAPVTLNLALMDDDAGGQVLTANGSVSAGALDLRLVMAEGFAALGMGRLQQCGSLEGADGAAMLAQFGLPEAELFAGEETVLASVYLDGRASDGFDGRVTISQGDETIGYFGALALGPAGQVSGTGTVELTLANGSAVATLMGADGIGIGAFEASAALSFDGAVTASATGIAGAAGAAGFGGALQLDRLGNLPSISGALQFDYLDGAGVAAAALSPAALVPGSGLWPEGPLASSATPRLARGSITIGSDILELGDGVRLEGASFDLAWDAQSLGINRLSGALGGGTVGMDLTVCCAGGLSARTLSGRLTLDGVDVAAVAPSGMGGAISGLLTGGVTFEGSGGSLAEAMAAMTGEGNLAISDLSVAGLASGVFPEIAGFDDVLNTEADALETLIGLSLGQGAFATGTANGAFTIAGGVLRLANVIMADQGAQLSGSVNLTLATLGLDGAFVLTPLALADTNGLVQPDTARIIARLAGTLLAPAVSIDLSEMVAALQVRANELEVERLEALRLADEARQRAAAEERNRLVEEQRRQAAEEAARRAAEEEAARLAAEAEAQRQAEEAARLAAAEAAQRAEEARQQELQRQFELQQQQMQLIPPPRPFSFLLD